MYMKKFKEEMLLIKQKKMLSAFFEIKEALLEIKEMQIKRIT